MAMEISIKIKKQRLPEFLSYLRSGLSQSGGWRGQGHYEDGGIFVEQLDIPLPSTSGESFQTKWILRWNPDGSLSPINVEAENGSPSGWEDSVNNLVKSALEATINQSKERFFRSAQQTRVVLGTTSDIAFLHGVVAGTLDANLLIQVNALINTIKEHGEVELWEEQ